MKEFLKKNGIYIMLILLTIISLGLSIYFYIEKLEFISSIFSNLFAGTTTGCIIAFISALKNRKKTNFIIMKNTYDKLFDLNFEFLEYNPYLFEIEDDEVFWNSAYEKLSKFIFINEYIIELSNEVHKKEYFKSIFINEFKYDAVSFKEQGKKIRSDIEQLKIKNGKEELLKKIRDFEIEILMFNIKLKKEINRYDNDIYEIEQFFI